MVSSHLKVSEMSLKLTQIYSHILMKLETLQPSGSFKARYIPAVTITRINSPDHKTNITTAELAIQFSPLSNLTLLARQFTSFLPQAAMPVSQPLYPPWPSTNLSPS